MIKNIFKLLIHICLMVVMGIAILILISGIMHLQETSYKAEVLTFPGHPGGYEVRVMDSWYYCYGYYCYDMINFLNDKVDCCVFEHGDIACRYAQKGLELSSVADAKDIQYQDFYNNPHDQDALCLMDVDFDGKEEFVYSRYDAEDPSDVRYSYVCYPIASAVGTSVECTALDYPPFDKLKQDVRRVEFDAGQKEIILYTLDGTKECYRKQGKRFRLINTEPYNEED